MVKKAWEPRKRETIWDTRNCRFPVGTERHSSGGGHTHVFGRPDFDVDHGLRLREHQRELRVGVEVGAAQSPPGAFLVPRPLKQSRRERERELEREGIGEREKEMER